jgi:hypothetical protein
MPEECPPPPSLAGAVGAGVVAAGVGAAVVASGVGASVVASGVGTSVVASGVGAAVGQAPTLKRRFILPLVQWPVTARATGRSKHGLRADRCAPDARPMHIGRQAVGVGCGTHGV